MRLTVEHVTRYIYAQPIHSLVQSHRLTPTLCENQTTLDWHVSVSDGVRGGTFRDGAGDLLQSWSVPGPANEVVVRVSGLVETRDFAGILKGNRELIKPEAYLRASELTQSDVALEDLAKGASGNALLEVAHQLSAAVRDKIAYRPGQTTMLTSAAQALAAGEGVCQDHAHALIALARLRQIPARFVTGYLYSEGKSTQDEGPMSGDEASHAWAELFIEGLGWVGFDPSNGCCPDERYIRLGSGFDAQDAAPIRGVARGQALGDDVEVLEVEVAVRQAQQ